MFAVLGLLFKISTLGLEPQKKYPWERSNVFVIFSSVVGLFINPTLLIIIRSLVSCISCGQLRRGEDRYIEKTL